MAGIVSYGAYLPVLRLSRELMSKAWGRGGGAGERTVANYNEDSLTMGVEAAFDCLKGVSREKIDGFFFASTTFPYREKLGATLAATVADLGRNLLTADYANSLRTGTTALRSALAIVRGDSARQVLVAAADCRLGRPNSDLEQSFGDGAAALLVGQESVIAEVEGSYSLSNEMVDVWRRSSDPYVNTWEDRFVVTHGYTENMQEAISTLMKRLQIGPKDITKAVLYAPDSRSHAGLARALGLDAKTQVQDPLLSNVGNTGAAHTLLMLVAALEQAKPGDRLLVAGYGDGCDVFLLRVTPEVEKNRHHRGVKGHLASKRMLSSYAKYLTYRGILETPAQAGLRLHSSATVMWRDRDPVLRLYGSRCRRCHLLQYPVQRVCYGCQAKDDFDLVRLSDCPGRLYTYSLDYLAGGVEPPIVQSVVALDGEETRIYCMMTDYELSEIRVDMPLEMTFRLLHEGGDFYNYFWNCRPMR